MKFKALPVWREAVREDIIVYSAILIFDFAHDFIANSLYHLKLRAYFVPYNFGFEQILILTFCGIQIYRKWRQWNYD